MKTSSAGHPYDETKLSLIIVQLAISTQWLKLKQTNSLAVFMCLKSLCWNPMWKRSFRQRWKIAAARPKYAEEEILISKLLGLNCIAVRFTTVSVPILTSNRYRITPQAQMSTAQLTGLSNTVSGAKYIGEPLPWHSTTCLPSTVQCEKQLFAFW